MRRFGTGAIGLLVAVAIGVGPAETQDKLTMGMGGGT